VGRLASVQDGGLLVHPAAARPAAITQKSSTELERIILPPKSEEA
jgi:hypothetical protein